MNQEQQTNSTSHWNEQELVINGETIQLNLNPDQAQELLCILYDDQREAIFKAVRMAEESNTGKED